MRHSSSASSGAGWVRLLALIVLAVSGYAQDQQTVPAKVSPKLRQVAILELPGRPGFDSTAFANGMLLLAHPGANTVDIFDPIKRRLVAQVTGVEDPRGMALDESNGMVYIATAGTNSITVLNSKSWKIEGSIGLKHTPENLLFVAPLKSLLVTNPRNRSVALVSIESLGHREAELALLDVQGRPQRMAWDAQKRIAYLTVEDRSEIIAIDPAKMSGIQDGSQSAVVMHTKLTASQPTGITFEPNSRRLFVAVRYAVLQMDADSGTEISRVPAAAGADALWLNAAGNTLYAASGDGSVNVINVGASKISSQGEFHADLRGHALAFDSVNKLVYLSGGREGKSKLVILKPLNGAPVSVTETAMKQ